MADVFTDTWDDIGADFLEFCDTTVVTVRQLNPQTGATVATASNVPALKRVTALDTPGQIVGANANRFLLRLSTIGFTPSSRDQIEEAGGTVWDVDGDGVQVIGFSQVVMCPVTLTRTDASQS